MRSRKAIAPTAPGRSATRLMLPLLAGAIPHGVAFAATLAVTNCNDAGSGSLREALTSAKTGDTVDMTSLNCAAISLATGELQVAVDDLTLRGPGAKRLAIVGGQKPAHQYSVLEHSGHGTLRIEALEVTDQNAAPYSQYRSRSYCIQSAGTVDLDRSIVTACSSGAIFAEGFSARDSTISNSFRGVTTNRGDVSIERSTISGNGQTIAKGGYCHALAVGFYASPPSTATILISNSTISGNRAYTGGGGCLLGSAAKIANSTVAFNTSDYRSGGLDVAVAELTIESSILAKNVGGTVVFGGYPDDLITGNHQFQGNNNLIMKKGWESPPPTPEMDPRLLPLADNGGPTQTHALAAGSPAIDSGNNVSGLATDQRGLPRAVGAGADIGAFEQQTFAVGPDITGSWYDPDQSGQGLMLEVLPGGNLLALWFSFSPSGQQAWFGGVGSYSGTTAVVDGVSLPTGGKWVTDFDSSVVAQNPWGSLTFTFADSDHGKVDFNSSLGFGTGSMKLTRLTRIASTGPSATDSAIGPPVAVVTDAFGNLYFSSAPDRIFKVDAQGAFTGIAGTGTPGYSGDGGAATRAQLNFPLSYPELVRDPVDFAPLAGGLARDQSGNLYIADAYNNRVRKIDSNGVITTLAGDGAPANSSVDIVAKAGHVYWPQGVAFDGAGNLYISSAYGPLFQLKPNGILHALGGSNCGPSYLGPGLCAPMEIAADSAGDVFVPDSYCRVRRVTADGAFGSGTFVTVAGADRASSGGAAYTCGYSGDGGPATKAAMSIPNGVAVDTSGNLYIADTGNSCIRKVDANGVITTAAGVCDPDTTHAGFGGDGGPATQARMNQPFGVAVDGKGNLYVADTYNNRVRKVSNGIITTVAGNGAMPSGPAAGAIGPSFTGNWYNPAQSGHGLMLEVLPGNRILALWFAFSPTGEQSWFGGVGNYSGNVATISGVALPTGAKWIPNFDSNAVVKNAWGTLTLTFSDCSHGKVDFASTYDGYGSGSMNLTRLTLPAGLACE